jgi:hypothetical protein
MNAAGVWLHWSEHAGGFLRPWRHLPLRGPGAGRGGGSPGPGRCDTDPVRTGTMWHRPGYGAVAGAGAVPRRCGGRGCRDRHGGRVRAEPPAGRLCTPRPALTPEAPHPRGIRPMIRYAWCQSDGSPLLCPRRGSSGTGRAKESVVSGLRAHTGDDETCPRRYPALPAHKSLQRPARCSACRSVRRPRPGDSR